MVFSTKIDRIQFFPSLTIELLLKKKQLHLNQRIITLILEKDGTDVFNLHVYLKLRM